MQAAFKGASVTVLEKYGDFVRRNVIIIWNDTKKDLAALFPSDLLQLSAWISVSLTYIHSFSSFGQVVETSKLLPSRTFNTHS